MAPGLPLGSGSRQRTVFTSKKKDPGPVVYNLRHITVEIKKRLCAKSYQADRLPPLLLSYRRGYTRPRHYRQRQASKTGFCEKISLHQAYAKVSKNAKIIVGLNPFGNYHDI